MCYGSEGRECLILCRAVRGESGQTSQVRYSCVSSQSDAEEMGRRLIILYGERRRMQSPGGKGVPFPGAWGWFGVACTERGSKLRVAKCLGSHAKEPGLYLMRHRAPPKEVRPPM